MTPTQKRLARHALGFSNTDRPNHRQSYRNRYCTGRHTLWESEWELMARAGLATMTERTGSFSYFRLTRAGAEAALRKGETLCPEDFPS